eukprot:SAG31_NODE_24066_length_490_cov_0.664962_1_plen_100_part_01
MNCGNPNFYREFLEKAVADKLVAQARVDSAFRRVVIMLLRLGLLGVDTPFDRFGATDVGLAATDSVCVEAARQSVVLLANRGGESLPLVLPSATLAPLAL